MSDYVKTINTKLDTVFTPLHIVLLTTASVLTLQKAWRLGTDADERQNLLSSVIRFAMKYIPGMGGAVAREQEKMGNKAKNAYPRLKSTKPITELPKEVL